LVNETALKLIEEGMLYPCSDHLDHDLHIDPEYMFDEDANSVERLLQAIFDGRLHDLPSIKDAGIKTSATRGVIAPNIVLGLSPEALNKKISFMQRNLGLNLATQAMKNGDFEATSRVTDEGVVVEVFATIVPPKRRNAFAWAAKKWVMDLIKRSPDLSDQRKDETIALIQSA
jgi:hypothetical protein